MHKTKQETLETEVKEIYPSLSQMKYNPLPPQPPPPPPKKEKKNA